MDILDDMGVSKLSAKVFSFNLTQFSFCNSGRQTLILPLEQSMD